MFLTFEELVELTGYRQANKQIEMLKKQGIPCYINAANEPKVVRSIFEQKPTKQTEKTKEWTPKWGDNQL